MSKIYIVKSGDTLWGISKKHHKITKVEFFLPFSRIK
ncbi:LysM domain-containing protein [Acinetobacter baumannii]|nr:LysM domain-containing protein [Acinetobacter baumannii]